jgi:hypothetical protein
MGNWRVIVYLEGSGYGLYSPNILPKENNENP